MAEKKTILIRADANNTIGTGHVMRCLALAQAWQDDGGKAIFLMAAGCSSAFEERLRKEGIDCIIITEQSIIPDDDASITADIAKKTHARWVVVDGYQFDAQYQKKLKTCNEFKVLFLDDYGHAKAYYADIILNQNVYASEKIYENREDYTKMLLGTQYVLLRREFRVRRGWVRQIPDRTRKILVTLGGADPDNITKKVLESLEKLYLEDLEIKVVVGGNFQNNKEIFDLVKQTWCKCEIVQNPINMAELMVWADIAISAGGSTCWEMAFLGLPNIINILSSDQELIATALSEKKISVKLMSSENNFKNSLIDAITGLLNSPKTYLELSKNGQNLIDGLGAERIVRILQDS